VPKYGISCYNFKYNNIVIYITTNSYAFEIIAIYMPQEEQELITIKQTLLH